MIERYTLPEMGAVWSEQNKFQKWLDVELAVCEVHAQMGTIPRDALEQIKSRAKFSVERINEIERTTNHDVIAFTTNLAEEIGEASRFVHFGLTPQTLSTQPMPYCSAMLAIFCLRKSASCLQY